MARPSSGLAIPNFTEDLIMADKLNFSLVSPARELFSGEVDHVVAPGSDGEFGVLANHAPFMSTL